MTISDIVKLVRRWWWVLILCPLLAAGAVYGVSSTMTPIYRATVTLLIEPSQVPGAVSYNDIMVAERLTDTYSRLLTSRSVLDETIQRLGSSINSDQLKEKISALPIRDTQLVTVAVSDPSPEQAANIANTLGQVFIDQTIAKQRTVTSASREELQRSLQDSKARIDDLSARIDELERQPDADSTTGQSGLDVLRSQLTQEQTTYTGLLEAQQRMDLAESQASTQISIADKAVAPTSAVSPRVLLNTVLGGVLGLMAAAGLVMLLGYLDDTVKIAEDVRRLTGGVALGSIPKLPGTDSGLAPVVQPRSAAAEAYRGVRTNLQFATVDQTVRSILVTSTRPGDGKTITVANLAATLAQGGQQVILVSADLRKPQLHKRFGDLSNRTGLTNLLLADASTEIEPLLQETGVPGLRVLTTGPLPANPSDILNSKRMRELLDQLEERADVVLFDSPPLALSDPLILAGIVDGIVLVTYSGRTRSQELIRAVGDLTRTGTPLLGVVINRADLKGEGYYNYQYYGSYGLEEDARVKSA